MQWGAAVLCVFARLYCPRSLLLNTQHRTRGDYNKKIWICTSLLFRCRVQTLEAAAPRPTSRESMFERLEQLYQEEHTERVRACNNSCAPHHIYSHVKHEAFMSNHGYDEFFSTRLSLMCEERRQQWQDHSFRQAVVAAMSGGQSFKLWQDLWKRTKDQERVDITISS